MLLDFQMIGGRRGVGLPTSGLLAKFMAPDLTDTIGLSISDYESLTADQQTFFFTNPTVPRTWGTFQDFWPAVSAESWFNNSETMGAEGKGVAVYQENTSGLVLKRAHRYFGVNPGTGFPFTFPLDLG